MFLDRNLVISLVAMALAIGGVESVSLAGKQRWRTPEEFRGKRVGFYFVVVFKDSTPDELFGPYASRADAQGGMRYAQAKYTSNERGKKTSRISATIGPTYVVPPVDEDSGELKERHLEQPVTNTSKVERKSDARIYVQNLLLDALLLDGQVLLFNESDRGSGIDFNWVIQKTPGGLRNRSTLNLREKFGVPECLATVFLDQRRNPYLPFVYFGVTESGEPFLYSESLRKRLVETAPKGVRFVGSPAAASWRAGRVDAVFVTIAGACWHVWRDFSEKESDWRWDFLGGNNLKEVAVCSWGEGRLDVFFTTSDGRLEQVYWDSSLNQWSHFHDLGRPPKAKLLSKPVAVCFEKGRIDLFVVGDDNELYQTYWNSTTSWPWLRMNIGKCEPTVGAVVGPGGTISVFTLRHMNRKLLQVSHYSQEDGWLPTRSQLTPYEFRSAPTGSVQIIEYRKTDKGKLVRLRRITPALMRLIKPSTG